TIHCPKAKTAFTRVAPQENTTNKIFYFKINKLKITTDRQTQNNPAYRAIAQKIDPARTISIPPTKHQKLELLLIPSNNVHLKLSFNRRTRIEFIANHSSSTR